MKRSEIRDKLEELKNDIAYLGKECVDDPEQVMNSLAANHCLKMLDDDKSGPDN